MSWVAPMAFLAFPPVTENTCSCIKYKKYKQKYEEGAKKIHTFMFYPILSAYTWVYCEIIFGYIHAPNRFEFLWSTYIKIQYMRVIKHNERLTFYCNFTYQHSTFTKIQFLVWLISQDFGGAHTICKFIAISFIFIYSVPNRFTKDFIPIHLVHRELSLEAWKLEFDFLRISTAAWSGRAQALLRVFHTVAWAF